MKDIHVFIVEDHELAMKLVADHFGTGITYASIHDEDERESITDALATV